MENRNLVFLDCTSNKNHQTIMNKAGGASEYQFYQLIKHFSKNNHNPIFCYNYSEDIISFDNITYLNKNNLENYNFHDNCRIIIHRFYPWEINVKNKLESHSLFIWIHDLPDYMIFVGRNDYMINYYKKEQEKYREYLKNNFINKKNITFILNSHHCKKLILDYFKSYNLVIDNKRMIVIYNILYEDELREAYEKQISVQKKKIVYASSWSKGIDDIIRIFDYIHERDKNFILELMNPGYGMENYVHLQEELKQRFPNNIIIHEPLSKKQYSEVIKSALCVLSSKFNETYGCVFAESYYLGTPVIADIRSGAVKEIIDNNFIVNFDDPQEVFSKINHLVSIRDNKKIYLSKKFSLKKIFPIWAKTLQ